MKKIVLLVEESLKNPLSKFTHRITPCPRCGQPLRFPIKSGKTLKVICPKCSTESEVTFSNPLKEVLKWDSHKNLKDNVSHNLLSFQSLSGKEKRSLIWFLVSFVLLLFFLMGNCSRQPTQSAPESVPVPSVPIEQKLFDDV